MVHSLPISAALRKSTDCSGAVILCYKKASVFPAIVDQFHFLPSVTEMKNIVSRYSEIGENNQKSALVGASNGFPLGIKWFLYVHLYWLKNILTC